MAGVVKQAITESTGAPAPALQPYQYQIATSPIPIPAAPEKPAAPVEKTHRKANWPSILAAFFGISLLIFGVLYFLNSNKPDTIEIRNPGHATRTPAKFSPGPAFTPTADTSGATFKGPTPGIGAGSQGASVQVTESDLPVYPGARRIDNPTGPVYFTEFITGDSFDKLSDWAKSAFSDKGWGNIELKSLPGNEGAVLTGRKGNLSAVTYLLGPGQKDTPPYDNFFKSANVEPNGSLIVINITAT
jgi:hypothetical protein